MSSSDPSAIDSSYRPFVLHERDGETQRLQYQDRSVRGDLGPQASQSEIVAEDVSGADPLAALESRYFPAPGVKDAAPFSRMSTVEPLVDGRDYFAAIKTHVATLVAGDAWYVAGWWIQRDFVFARGGPTLFDLLVEKASAGVDVRVIFWASRALIDFPAIVGTSARVAPIIAVVQSNIAGAEELRARTDARGATLLAGRVLIDWSGNMGSSQHMKINVFSHGGRLTAFAGGLDYAPARLSAPGHKPAPGWHDAGTRLTGDAAMRVLATYVTRWEEASTLSAATFDIGGGSKPYNPRPITALTAPAAGPPLAPSAVTSVQVVRSFPDSKESVRNPFRPNVRWTTLPRDGVHEARLTFQKMLRAAQRYIYVEDQAFDAVVSLFPALVDACRRGVKVIALLPGTQDPTEGRSAAPRALSSEVVNGLLAPLTPAQRLNVSVWQLRGSFVHSKLILVDDELVSIGSANFMDRSMQETNAGDDAEVSAIAVTTGTLVRDLRVQLWAEHMGVKDADGLADLRDLSKSLGNWRQSWGTGIRGSLGSRVGDRVFVGPTTGELSKAVHSGAGSAGSAGHGGSSGKQADELDEQTAADVESVALPLDELTDDAGELRAESEAVHQEFMELDLERLAGEDLEEVVERDLPAPVTVDPFPSAYKLDFEPARCVALQKCLDEMATAGRQAAESTLIEQRHLAGAATLPAALVDLTDGPLKLAYAGSGLQDDTYYVGSLAKIAPMYAAFELRVRVQRVVTEARAAGLDVGKPGWHVPVVKAIERTWRATVQRGFPQLTPSFPDLATIFDFVVGAAEGEEVRFKSGPADVSEVSQTGEFGSPGKRMGFDQCLTLMVRWSNNRAAGRVIRPLGYSYINGALREAGFFDATRKGSQGLWLSASYDSHDWKPKADLMALSRPGTEHYKATTNLGANARQIARLLALAATNQLFGSGAVGTQACRDMIALMAKRDGGGGTVSFVATALTARGISIDTVSSKIGIGVASPRSGRAGAHDCAIIQRKTAAGTTLTYVVVGLGAFTRALPRPLDPAHGLPEDPASPGALMRLFFELDRCVERAH
jgi:phosphatidylserine/phosphatidylglycerophosphate/cardiolipin synthase-like enzyme